MNIHIIIAELQKKLLQKEMEIKEIKNELDVFRKYLPSKNYRKKHERTSGEGIIPNHENMTFNSVILKLLGDGIPKTAKTLYELYKEFVSNPDYKYGTFSSNLSVSKGIKKHKAPNKPANQRTYYGKSEWFYGKFLRKKYIDRIL